MDRIPKILLLIESARRCERDFLRGISRYVRLHGPWAFYRKPKSYIKSNRRELLLAQIKDFGPDGIIASDIENLKEIVTLGKPTIIHAFKGNCYDMPVVLGDTEETGKMGAEHLLEQGFRRFAFCGFGDYYWSRERYDSFRKTIQDAGYKTSYYRLNPKNIKTAAPEELKHLSEWLISLDNPVGLMTCADDCSQYVIEACKIADIQVPEEIGIIGVDNDDMVCDLSNPQLSSIALDFITAGYEAAELLEQLMDGEQVDKKVITARPSHVETRASTDIYAISDPDVATAVRFIRKNANQLIQMADVLNQVTCCQRALHQKFKQTLGRSVHHEIKRVRIEKISNLLRETNLPISQIATMLGYFSVNHISRYFKQATGMTPLAYRKRFISK